MSEEVETEEDVEDVDEEGLVGFGDQGNDLDSDNVGGEGEKHLTQLHRGGTCSAEEEIAHEGRTMPDDYGIEIMKIGEEDAFYIRFNKGTLEKVARCCYQ